MAALELVGDYDLPVNGDMWTAIRELRLPIEITSGNAKDDIQSDTIHFVVFCNVALTDMELRELLFRMIDADYKLRPSVKDVLSSPAILDQVEHQTAVLSDTNPLNLSYRFVICLHRLPLIQIASTM